MRRMAQPPKAAQKAKRQRRLSAALRENLKRRKAQAKERSAAEIAAESTPASPDSTGIGKNK
jgi:hypothetical protein